MTPQYLIGVDLGTSATKAALYHLDGRLAGQATLETPLYHPQPGAVEQDCDDFYRTAAQTVRQCIVDSGVDPRQVAAIAFDSQMAGLAAIDEAYRPAARFDSWLDMRCQPYIEALERDYGEKITRLTGCPPTCDHGPKMLWWKEEQPAVYARTAKYLMPAAYVAGAMAGLKAEAAFMDDTFLHFTALSDAQAGAWSGELCSLLGIDPPKAAAHCFSLGSDRRDDASRGARLWPCPRPSHCGRLRRHRRRRPGRRHRPPRDAAGYGGDGGGAGRLHRSLHRR